MPEPSSSTRDDLAELRVLEWVAGTPLPTHESITTQVPRQIIEDARAALAARAAS